MYCTVGMCTTVQKSPLLIFLLQKKHCSGPKLVLVSKSPPQKAMPARLKDNSMGMQYRRWSHVASVSPVQTAPESHKPKHFTRQEDKRIYITALPLAHAYQAPHTHTQFLCFAGLPSLWDPAKKERVKTKGLSVPPERVISPSTVAMCW